MDRDLLGPTFQSEPLQSHTTNMHMQTSNSQFMRGSRADFKQSMLVLLCSCKRQIVNARHVLLTVAPSTCTHTSNRKCTLQLAACSPRSVELDLEGPSFPTWALQSHTTARVWNCGFLGFLSVVGREGGKTTSAGSQEGAEGMHQDKPAHTMA